MLLAGKCPLLTTCEDHANMSKLDTVSTNKAIYTCKTLARIGIKLLHEDAELVLGNTQPHCQGPYWSALKQRVVDQARHISLAVSDGRHGQRRFQKLMESLTTTPLKRLLFEYGASNMTKMKTAETMSLGLDTTLWQLLRIDVAIKWFSREDILNKNRRTRSVDSSPMD